MTSTMVHTEILQVLRTCRPLSAGAIARMLGRPLYEIQPYLDALVKAGVLAERRALYRHIRGTT